MKNIFIFDSPEGILINEWRRSPKTIKVRNLWEAFIIIGNLLGINSPLHSGQVPQEDPYPLATIKDPYTIDMNMKNKVVDNIILCLTSKFFQIEWSLKSPNQIAVFKIDKNSIRISARAKWDGTDHQSSFEITVIPPNIAAQITVIADPVTANIAILLWFNIL